MKISSKRQMWERRIAAWQRSGLSRGVWCAAHDVNVHTLDYWRYRLRDAGAARGKVKAKAKANETNGDRHQIAAGAKPCLTTQPYWPAWPTSISTRSARAWRRT